MTRNSIESLLTEYDRVMDQAVMMCYATRAVELQAGSAKKIISLRKKAQRLKKNLVAAGDLANARSILCMQLFMDYVFSELGMWIGLKEEKPNGAWDWLITAQVALEAYMRIAGDNVAQFQNLKRLQALETLLFPPQRFLSSGFVIQRAKCSVCRKAYDRCEHIQGEEYLGELCRTIITKADVHEISLVDVPHDRRCRIEEISKDGVLRDVMTWRILSREKKKGVSFSGRGVVFSNHTDR